MTLTEEENYDSEEPDLPEKCTKSDLMFWASMKNKLASSPTSQHDVSSDNYSLLHSSEQHQQGLSVFMKRCRRDIMSKPPKPDLTHVANSRMPLYLQDVQRFNPELMNHARTQEHWTLPTREIIEDEKRNMEADTKKIWHKGLVIRTNPNLVDPKWKREQENEFIMKVQKKTRERSAHVLLGVLQQWQKAQDRGGTLKSHSPTVLPQLTVSSSEPEAVKSSSESVNEVVEEAQTSHDADSEKQPLETVPEDEEVDIENEILRHSSR